MHAMVRVFVVIDKSLIHWLRYAPVCLRLSDGQANAQSKGATYEMMAVAVVIAFSAPSFAGEEKKDKKDEKKGGHVLVYGDENKDKKEEKKGGHVDTFGEKKEDKKDEKKGK